MYKFIVKLTNMNTLETIEKVVEVEEQFFEKERDIFIYAMGKAYDMAKGEFTFDGIELLCC